jgi:poly(A) polymerase
LPKRISRLRPNASLSRIFTIVRAAAPETYLVGGSLRDLLLRREPADLDFVTTADANAAAGAIAAALRGSAFALDAARGYYRVVAGNLPAIDLTAVEADTIEADLRRRDFTVDALAAPLLPNGALGEVIDPAGGLADIDAKSIRMVSERVLDEDPLRLLRAARLAMGLDFTIDAATAAAIRSRATRINATAAERQREEITRLLATPRAGAGFRLLDELGLLAELLPELMAGRGVEQPIVHHWDVFDHSIETLATLDALLADVEARRSAPLHAPVWLRSLFRAGLAWYPLDAYLDEKVGGQTRLVLLKLAGLLHDVAKPETRSVEADGRVRFFGHAELGAGKARRICERLRFGGRETKFVASLVEEHLRPTQLTQKELPTPRAIYRFFRDLGDTAPACLILSLADGVAAAGPRLTPERWAGYVAYIGYVLEQGQAQTVAIKQAPRLVTGDDLMAALAIPSGPEVGRLLALVEEAIAAGDVKTKAEALAYAGRSR